MAQRLAGARPKASMQMVSAAEGRSGCVPRAAGKLRQAYREGQEDQLGVLGLVLNAVVLWNPGDIDAAVAGLRSSGYPVVGENAARLSLVRRQARQHAGPVFLHRRHPAACARCATRRPQTAIRTRATTAANSCP
jgi:Tn3 transposase DDE domain